MSRTTFTSVSPRRLQLQASLCINQQFLSLLALGDSGADDSFLDARLASQVGIHTVPLDSPISVNALDGKFLAQITHLTVPLLLVLSGNHRDCIQLNIIFFSNFSSGFRTHMVETS